MVYSSVPQSRRPSSGIAVLVANKWSSRIEDYAIRSEILITLSLIVGRGHIIIVGIYAPE